MLLDGLKISVGSIVGERTQFDRGLSAVLAEHLHGVGVGQFQRCQSGLVLGVHGGSVGDQHLDRGTVAASRCTVKGGHALGVRFVDLGFISEK